MTDISVKGLWKMFRWFLRIADDWQNFENGMKNMCDEQYKVNSIQSIVKKCSSKFNFKKNVQKEKFSYNQNAYF